MATTKKTYEAVATLLRAQRQQIEAKRDGTFTTAQAEAAKATVDDIADKLAFYFQQDNPAFDRFRFLKATGVGQ